MEFRIDQEIFDLFPGIRVVGLAAAGLANRDDDGRVAAVWEDAWRRASELTAQYPNSQSHPHVAAWRRALKQVGVSHKDFPSSIEALLRRAMKGADPVRINPLVDLLNAVSLRWVVPAGGWDLAEVGGDLELRTTRAGDTFQSLDAEAPVAVEDGEVAYVDGGVVLTRHFVWRQSRQALVAPATTDVLLVSEVLGDLGDDVARGVVADLADDVTTLFGVAVAPFTLHAGEPSFTWSR